MAYEDEDAVGRYEEHQAAMRVAMPAQRARLDVGRDPSRDPSPIDGACNQLREAVGELRLTILDLAARLGPVLVEESPTPTSTEAGVARPMMSMHHGFLAATTDEIDSLRGRVQSILIRLEL